MRSLCSQSPLLGCARRALSSVAFQTMYNVVTLSAATSTENLQALEEVKDFRTTDLGRGGRHRWTYHILSESAVDGELQRLCEHRSSKSVDSVTFQPCSEYGAFNQDRYNVEEWDLHGGIWQFNAIYDGTRPPLPCPDNHANPVVDRSLWS